MNEEINRQKVVDYWRQKSRECLAAAWREYEAGAFDFSINRIYYSVFYATSAALLKRQLSFKKHAGVRSAFHTTFIRSGLLKDAWGKFYDQLFEDRQEGDYIAFQSFEADYVKEQLELCEQFLGMFEPFIINQE